MATKNPSTRFRLIKITTEQFAIIDVTPKEDNRVKLNTKIKFGFNPEKRAIGVFTNISFLDEEKPFLIIETGCHFEIEPQDWEKLIIEENKIILTKNLASHFTMISLGTARGILHQKTLNTEYNKYFIPLISINTLIKNDIILGDEIETKKAESI